MVESPLIIYVIEMMKKVGKCFEQIKSQSVKSSRHSFILPTIIQSLSMIVLRGY